MSTWVSKTLTQQPYLDEVESVASSGLLIVFFQIHFDERLFVALELFEVVFGEGHVLDQEPGEEVLQVSSDDVSALWTPQRIRDVVGDRGHEAVEHFGCRQFPDHFPNLFEEAFAVVFQEFREPVCQQVDDVDDSALCFDKLAEFRVWFCVQNCSEVVGPLFKWLFEVVRELFDRVQRLVDAEGVDHAHIENLFLFDGKSFCAEILNCFLHKH